MTKFRHTVSSKQAVYPLTLKGEPVKRGVKRVTVTDKMASETRGESYWDNWAQRRADEVNKRLQNPDTHAEECNCDE